MSLSFGIVKLLKFISVCFIILFFGFITLMFQPWVYLPHSRIEIGLPIEPSDDATTYLIPMGEKIEHNASNGTPDGHPGIDFGGWNREVRIVSVSDGWVIGISKDKAGATTVSVWMGFYRATYQELNRVDPNLRIGSEVKKGQVIGYTGYRRDNLDERPPEFPSGQLHWDFASSSFLIDRLCPLNYFDKDARLRIEAIWDRVPANDQFKSQYPEICNGVFKGKED